MLEGFDIQCIQDLEFYRSPFVKLVFKTYSQAWYGGRDFKPSTWETEVGGSLCIKSQPGI